MFDQNPNNTYAYNAYNPQPQVQTKFVSTLTPDEYEKLTKTEGFSLALTETDRAKAVCNHRTLDGSQDTLVDNGDGSMTCKVCGYTFRPLDMSTSKDEIQEGVNLAIDVLQTIKLLYPDMPRNASREFMQIIGLLEKVPTLFQRATENFSQHENYNPWGMRGQGMNTMNMFSILSSALNTGNYGQMYQQQPMYGQQVYGQGQFAQQPMYGQPMQSQPMAGQPVGSVPPTSNGFGYMGAQPMYGQPYAPQQTGFQYTPNQNPAQPYQPQQAPAQPGTTAPTEQQSQTDGQTVQTTAQFKA